MGQRKMKQIIHNNRMMLNQSGGKGKVTLYQGEPRKMFYCHPQVQNGFLKGIKCKGTRKCSSNKILKLSPDKISE